MAGLVFDELRPVNIAAAAGKLNFDSGRSRRHDLANERDGKIACMYDTQMRTTPVHLCIKHALPLVLERLLATGPLPQPLLDNRELA